MITFSSSIPHPNPLRIVNANTRNSPATPIMYTESQSSNKKEEERRGTKVQSNLMGYQNLLSNQPNENPPAKVNKCNDKNANKEWMWVCLSAWMQT